MFYTTSAKRYERLLKAHNIVLTPSNRGNGEGSSRARANAPAPKAPRAATRKRAIRDEDDDSEDIDNIKKEEGGPSPLKKNKVVSALAEGLCLTWSSHLKNEVADMNPPAQSRMRNSPPRCSNSPRSVARIWGVASRLGTS